MLAANLLQYDAQTGEIEGRTPTIRHLSDLAGSFADPAAYQQALAAGNPLLYRATQVEDAREEGDLHYGLAILYPGKVGDEYYMTKGHIHAWRPAAEVYIGLAGQGLMLLEDERSGECIALPLERNRTVYVPGYTAHRTINTGNEPLVYWGILSSRAGHDYGSIGKRNFSKMVVEVDGRPTVLERSDYLRRIEHQSPARK
ncbi:MAG: glucose-6-phosphate isomerase family protein [Caldilineaceae bacterium]